MVSFVVTFIIGLVCIVLGISNMKGNIESLHSYHRHRVSEEDRLPFGRMVGLGTVIIGGDLIVFGTLNAIASYTGNELFSLIGSGILIVGIAIGAAISFYAMIKYNKGIF
jgi:hypothetical protein